MLNENSRQLKNILLRNLDTFKTTIGTWAKIKRWNNNQLNNKSLNLKSFKAVNLLTNACVMVVFRRIVCKLDMLLIENWCDIWFFFGGGVHVQVWFIPFCISFSDFFGSEIVILIQTWFTSFPMFKKKFK